MLHCTTIGMKNSLAVSQWIASKLGSGFDWQEHDEHDSLLDYVTRLAIDARLRS
jgi:hypothetical protein